MYIIYIFSIYSIYLSIYSNAYMLICFSHVQLFQSHGLQLCQTALSMGILQARILEWVATLSSRGSSWPRDQTCISCIAGGFYTTEPLGKSYVFKYICIYKQRYFIKNQTNKQIQIYCIFIIGKMGKLNCYL